MVPSPVPLHVTALAWETLVRQAQSLGNRALGLALGFCHRPAFSTFTRPSVALHSQLFAASTRSLVHSSTRPLTPSPSSAQQPNALPSSQHPHTLFPSLPFSAASAFRYASRLDLPCPLPAQACLALPCLSKYLPTGPRLPYPTPSPRLVARRTVVCHCLPNNSLVLSDLTGWTRVHNHLSFHSYFSLTA